MLCGSDDSAEARRAGRFRERDLVDFHVREAAPQTLCVARQRLNRDMVPVRCERDQSFEDQSAVCTDIDDVAVRLEHAARDLDRLLVVETRARALRRFRCAEDSARDLEEPSTRRLNRCSDDPVFRIDQEAH